MVCLRFERGAAEWRNHRAMGSAQDLSYLIKHFTIVIYDSRVVLDMCKYNLVRAFSLQIKTANQIL